MAKRMAEQMELFEPVERGFEEGGLMDEGGMVDEESGNEVPPGSLREEVRDDIPAQLSEGEFVFPADVVRYIGLENLMRMRQEAKQGLAQMEAMGQMGNSEEATVQDDLPFDMYDLDVEDDAERNYQVGGYVPPSIPQQPYNQPTQVNPQTGTYTLPGTGIAGYQVPSGAPTGFTPYGGATPYFQPVQFTGAQYQTALQTTNLPTFAETVGQKAGQYDELRTYINDAGQTLQIPFKDGRPIYPIPEGYRPIGDQPKPEEEQTTVTPTLGQTTVRDEGGGDGADAGPSSSPFGGNKSTLDSSAYSKAVTNLAKNQLTSLSPTISIMGQLTGKPTANDIATASNTARNTAVNALGLSNISQATVSQLDAIGSAMNVASNLTGIGSISNSKAAAATVAEAVATAVSKGNMSVEQANALSEMTMDEETGALVGKDGKTGKDMSQADINAITAFAEAMATDDDEDQGLTGPSFDDSSLGKGLEQSGRQGPSFDDSSLGKGSGNTGSQSGGFGAGQSTRGDPSDTGKGSGGGGDSSDGGSESGGASGGGCFEKGTLFKMADGTTKCVEDIKPGDKMYKGGLVYAVMQGDGLLEDWYDYNGIHVTSAHPVLDNGIWKRVGETSSKKAIDKREIYYSLMNTNHLMIAENGTEFTDFVEISADIGGRGEWMMEMLNQRQAA